MVNLPPPKKTVYATCGNTPAVRAGAALPGYVKDELWDRAQMLAYGEACAKAATQWRPIETAPHKGNVTMKNQHLKITGHRDLTQAEIDAISEVKALAEQCGQLVASLRARRTKGL